MNEISKPAVLITGAGSGIGAATARLFSEQGHALVLTGRRQAMLESVARKLKTPHQVIACDLTDAEAVNHLVAEALRQNPDIGILVNNAGIYEPKTFTKANDDDWQKVFNTNLFAVVRLTRLLVPHFQTQGAAAIVNVASTAGLRPVAHLTAYAASKAALISLTQSLALELAASHIRVNCVCPGVVETPIHNIESHSATEQSQIRQTWAKMHPLGRTGTPEEVAWSIYQLTSARSQWLTGVVLPVDGGISLT